MKLRSQEVPAMKGLYTKAHRHHHVDQLSPKFWDRFPVSKILDHTIKHFLKQKNF